MLDSSSEELDIYQCLESFHWISTRYPDLILAPTDLLAFSLPPEVDLNFVAIYGSLLLFLGNNSERCLIVLI